MGRNHLAIVAPAPSLARAALGEAIAAEAAAELLALRTRDPAARRAWTRAAEAVQRAAHAVVMVEMLRAVDGLIADQVGAHFAVDFDWRKFGVLLETDATAAAP